MSIVLPAALKTEVGRQLNRHVLDVHICNSLTSVCAAVNIGSKAAGMMQMGEAHRWCQRHAMVPACRCGRYQNDQSFQQFPRPYRIVDASG